LGRRSRLLVGGAFLVVLSTLSLVGVSGGPGRLAEYLASIPLDALAAALVLLLAADLVRVARLMLLARAEGARVGFRAALAARLVGRFFGILTPAYTGATPARAAVLAAMERIEPGEALARWRACTTPWCPW